MKASLVMALVLVTATSFAAPGKDVATTEAGKSSKVDVLTEKGKKLFEKSKVKADEVAAKAKEVGVQIKNAASEHAKVVVHNLAEAGYPIKGIDREAAAAKEGDGALEVAKKIAEKVENCKSSECYSKGIDDGITDSGKNLEEVKKACKE